MTIFSRMPASYYLVSPNNSLTPLRRDLLLAVVALMLLFSPVLVSATNISETTYTYERVEVVVNEEDGITYAGDPQLSDTPISKEIGCSVSVSTRTCAFERHLLSNVTVPTEAYTTNPAATLDVGIDRYQYVQINGSVYEPIYRGNWSVQRDDGLYRVDLALESTSAVDALHHVSINASTESEDVSPVVLKAARQGSAIADREVEIPQTPIQVDSGAYYRVYVSGQNEPSSMGSLLGTILPIFGVLVGLYICYGLSRQIEIRYTGEDEL